MATLRKSRASRRSTSGTGASAAARQGPQSYGNGATGHEPQTRKTAPSTTAATGLRQTGRRDRPEHQRGVDVEVVRRLVEQQDVAARLEQLGQVDPVALPARQRADQLLLVRAAEVEARHVGAGGQLARADLDELDALGDLLEDRLVGREVVAALVDVAQLDRVADLDRAGVGRLLARRASGTASSCRRRWGR